MREKLSSSTVCVSLPTFWRSAVTFRRPYRVTELWARAAPEARVASTARAMERLIMSFVLEKRSEFGVHGLLERRRLRSILGAKIRGYADLTRLT